jgi:2,3-bisphosphoglycerate-independent phosphoglycerate mutase
MGNSEVGHLNIGAGRVVMQELPRVSQAAKDGSLARAPALTELIAKMQASGGTCHLLGLMSPGGVHSHQDHAVALADILHKAGVRTVVHTLTDGRDTPPRSAADDIAWLQGKLPRGVPIATVIGRYFAMDRDKRCDRVAKAYAALVDGDGTKFDDPVKAVRDSYTRDVTDEFITPAISGEYKGMQDGDGVLCFNFRADRVREILGALLEPEFDGFPRKRVIRFAAAAGMTRYSDELAPYLGVLFPPQKLDHILGQVAAEAGRSQLRTAETEKYPHVTYFLNGGQETTFPCEDRIMVPSPKVATYDLQPEMSAPELTDKVVAAIDSEKYDLIVLNYANPDMVGHTGSLPAAIKAVETVDAGLGRIASAVETQGGALLVTADHGNCELMRDPTNGGPHTAHTTNPVPVLLMGGDATALKDGRLADVAPTLLELMGLERPREMTGNSLIRAHAARAAE